jgi:hypothetical protein
MMAEPLPDGIYWVKNENGAWIPMGVAEGERFLLIPLFGAHGLPAETASVVGPLQRPKAPAR